MLNPVYAVLFLIPAIISMDIDTIFYKQHNLKEIIRSDLKTLLLKAVTINFQLNLNSFISTGSAICVKKIQNTFRQFNVPQSIDHNF